mgnify:CR=1 FL=1
MSNPTRQEILNAHDSLEEITGYLDHSFSGYTRNIISALLENVRDALPPRPQTTMADVEWDDDEHYLAEAEHAYWGKVIMLYRHAGLRQIQYLRAGGANEIRLADPADLTPTGRRYTLTEVQDD